MPPIEIVRESVTLAHLRDLAEAGFGDLVKGVVDVDLGIVALGGDMHADEEAALLDLGSRQDSLWGINLYPGEYGSPASGTGRVPWTIRRSDSESSRSSIASR